MMKWWLFLLAGLLVTAGCSCHVASSPEKVIGATATIHVEEAKLQSPAMILIGSVVSLRDKLDWQVGDTDLNNMSLAPRSTPNLV